MIGICSVTCEKNEKEKEKTRPDLQRFVVPGGFFAHPAGFEPTACRLGDKKKRFLRISVEILESPGRLDF